jgi:hypothetical protein
VLVIVNLIIGLLHDSLLDGVAAALHSTSRSG